MLFLAVFCLYVGVEFDPDVSKIWISVTYRRFGKCPGIVKTLLEA